MIQLNARRSTTFVNSVNDQKSVKGKKTRIYKLGEPGSGTRPRGEIQDFYALRAKCLQDGTLFEDPTFPADYSSVRLEEDLGVKLEWKRPTELVNDPKLFVDGASRFDVCQGSLGDCWMLASIAELTLNQTLFYQVVPKDQGFKNNYAGIFHFRFWQYGRWIDVVVDDRLVVKAGTKDLVFLSSKEKNEFWSALLEKAYAKLYGYYGCLDAGLPQEALEDFIGGITESYSMSDAPENLFQIMRKSFERGALIGCGKLPVPGIKEDVTPEGLVCGHAYSVTAVTVINLNFPKIPKIGGNIQMVRLRNPWGKTEWNGPWSDMSPEWKAVPEAKRKELGLVKEEDGEFWMSFKDFSEKYDLVDICHLSPDTVAVGGKTPSCATWFGSAFDGAWVAGVSAGGLCTESGTTLETMAINPQYCLTLVEPDDDDEKCTLLVALMQKNRRNLRPMGKDMLWIAPIIYHLDDPESDPKPLDFEYISQREPVNNFQNPFSGREVTCRLKVPLGKYIIVPVTRQCDEDGEYILRVFTENQHQMEEYDKCINLEDCAMSAKEQNAAVDAFKKIAHVEEEITWKQLQNVLNSSLKRGAISLNFTNDICRSLVAMMDVDKSGKLSMEEFKRLFCLITKWKNAFVHHDVDNSGNLDASELRATLEVAGFELNTKILNALVLRYGNEGTIAAEDFLPCAIKLKSAIDTFKKKDSENTKKATFSLDEWVENVMYA